MNSLSLQVKTSGTGAWLKSGEENKGRSSSSPWKSRGSCLSLTRCMETSRLMDPVLISKFSCLLSGEKEPSSCMKAYLQLVRSTGAMMGTCPEYNCPWILVILPHTEIHQRQKRDRGWNLCPSFYFGIDTQKACKDIFIAKHIRCSLRKT